MSDRLVIDIDSGTLGACVVSTGDVPVISDVRRVPLGTGEIRDPSALLPFLKEALTQVIPEYAKRHPGIRDVSIVIASPWFDASVRTLSSKAERPVTVSRSSVAKVARTEGKPLTDKSKVKVESLPLTVLVNGYRTRVQKSVHGKTLSITLYESIMDAPVHQTVEDAVHTSLARAKITWHTTPLAYAETLLRISEESHATVIDIGAEVTDVVVLSHESVAFVGSIPHGTRTIARAVSGAKDGALADTMSRLSMFARGELNEKEMQAMSAALSQASIEWQKAYLELIRQAGNTVPVPHRVFVVGERDELAWCTQVIMGAENRGQRPLPTIVANDFFGGLLTYGEGGVFDSSLALDALFFHMQSEPQFSHVSNPPVLYSVK